MKFYISSRLNNSSQVSQVANRLKDAGWIHTCDWTIFDCPSDTPHGLDDIAKREWDGIQAADVLIVLTPEGRGTHIELGMAIALKKRIYLYHIDDTYFKCDDATCAFYWLPEVTQLSGELDKAIEVILQENKSIH